jgi:hypothetical protein
LSSLDGLPFEKGAARAQGRPVTQLATFLAEDPGERVCLVFPDP